MNKSVIIIISIVWVMCNMFLFMYGGSPYRSYAMVGAWAASFLLLACIIIYIKKHKDTKNKSK